MWENLNLPFPVTTAFGGNAVAPTDTLGAVARDDLEQPTLTAPRLLHCRASHCP